MLAKPNTLVYFRRDNLILSGKHMGGVKLKLNESVIKNMEIYDPDKFIEVCRNFFDEHNVKNKRVLVVLDKNVVFSKTIKLSKDNKEEINRIVAQFEELIPFEAGQRVSLRLHSNDETKLFATNADIYIALEDALRRSGMKKLVAVTPAEMYNLDFSAKPSAIVDQFLDDKDVPKNADFLSANPF